MKVFNRKHNGRPVAWRVLLVAIPLVGILVIAIDNSYSKIQGVCSNCHTMHNSQDGVPMNFDGSSTPNEYLTRGTCSGCHAQGGASATVMMGPNVVPQVMHSGANHLAGGNFGYITGLAGSGAADSKGHNIVALTGKDDVFTGNRPPPGAFTGIGGDPHPSWNFLRSDILGCAGVNGCHGYRAIGGSADYFPNGVYGAHHKNEDGQLANPSIHANSYRFLFGVKGLESADWQENPTSANHNEYFGRSEPEQIVCGTATSCHAPPGGIVKPTNGTITRFCATCHGDFHTLESGESAGIGDDAISPFIRHPTDLSLPATGEYAAYTEYKLSAPVARLTVPATSSSLVTPGSDAVMCLSCHLAHASDYPDMLRWDYTTMIASDAGAAAGTGCFTCHTTKD